MHDYPILPPIASRAANHFFMVGDGEYIFSPSNVTANFGDAQSFS